MRTAKRIEKLPPYLFASLDRRIAEARDRGVDVISFAIGDPDRPTPSNVVAAAVTRTPSRANAARTDHAASPLSTTLAMLKLWMNHG